jgi:hypothetical protein
VSLKHVFQILIACLLLVTIVDARNFSVGYQYGMERYYPGAWSALDQGRKEAQREWAKWANITWSASSRPNVYIRPTGRSDVWGYYSGNSIYVTYSRKVWKVDSQWKDSKAWKSLFLHEYGHYLLLPNGHCDNPVPGTSGKCLMTIKGGRQPKLCPSCLKRLQAKYGKPRAAAVEEAVVDEPLIVLGECALEHERKPLRRRHESASSTHGI